MKEVSIDRNSFWLHHTKTAACIRVNIIMKHAPIYNRHNDVSCVCFFTSSASK